MRLSQGLQGFGLEKKSWDRHGALARQAPPPGTQCSKIVNHTAVDTSRQGRERPRGAGSGLQRLDPCGGAGPCTVRGQRPGLGRVGSSVDVTSWRVSFGPECRALRQTKLHPGQSWPWDRASAGGYRYGYRGLQGPALAALPFCNQRAALGLPLPAVRQAEIGLDDWPSSATVSRPSSSHSSVRLLCCRILRIP